MKKLIFFDLDGTLSPTNSWYLFNLYFGMSEEEDKVMFDWYRRGLITYPEWDDLITKILREKNQCTKGKVEIFAETIAPRPETQDLINVCKEAGYTTIILSGTMKQIAESFRARLNIDLSYTCSEIVFRDDGTFEDIANDKDEAPAKLRIFERICAEHGADPEQTIMVGDGGNDIEVFKRTKKGIQIGGYEPLKEFAWKKIENLKEIIDLI
jgi:phosphoserine phosphatase